MYLNVRLFLTHFSGIYGFVVHRVVLLNTTTNDISFRHTYLEILAKCLLQKSRIDLQGGGVTDASLTKPTSIYFASVICLLLNWHGFNRKTNNETRHSLFNHTPPSRHATPVKMHNFKMSFVQTKCWISTFSYFHPHMYEEDPSHVHCRNNSITEVFNMYNHIY